MGLECGVRELRIYSTSDEPTLQRQLRTVSFVLRDAFLGEKLSERLFCRLTLIPFHTFQSSLDTFKSLLSYPALLEVSDNSQRLERPARLYP